VPSNARVRAYPALERHRWVWVWMGEAAKADPALIPDLHWNDAPGWTPASSCLHVKADYLLLVENLLDMSHLPYVHANSLGSPEDTNPSLDWERGEDFVRGTRLSKRISPSKTMRDRGIDFMVDQTQVMIFTPPSHISIEVLRIESAPPAGSKPRVATHNYILNSMTPETPTTCRYYWTNARDFETDNAALTAMVMKQVSGAFEEDRDILEAQQRIIDLDPSAATLNVVGDAGAVHARRIVSKLLENERTPARLSRSA
jgi:vanillate O-demethylase monooxygenase subunit